MKIVSLFVLMLFSCILNSQEINRNLLVFDCQNDSVQIDFGGRFGYQKLTQRQIPKHASLKTKRAYENFPQKIQIANFVVGARVRFARNAGMCTGHDAVMNLNISLLRTTASIGYQYSYKHGYLCAKAGYEVYSTNNGKYQISAKSFSDNIPFVGFEFGYDGLFGDRKYRSPFVLARSGCEYDFGNLGWYAWGFATCRIVDNVNISFLFPERMFALYAGPSFDGIWGYGGIIFFRMDSFALYGSWFQGQLPFQETRFPEQRLGMEQGFAIGIQKGFQ